MCCEPILPPRLREHPQMSSLDLTVPTDQELGRQHGRAQGLGAWVLLDRSDDPEEALYVYADPAPLLHFRGARALTP